MQADEKEMEAMRSFWLYVYDKWPKRKNSRQFSVSRIEAAGKSAGEVAWIKMYIQKDGWTIGDFNNCFLVDDPHVTRIVSRFLQKWYYLNENQFAFITKVYESSENNTQVVLEINEIKKLPTLPTY
ncbi:MAG: hypothetical protein ACFFG0_41175 [Candidatus Thorarchaeota archaeon]